MAPPDWTYWLELGVTAVLTSVVSGVMGMAGGMLLLAVMLLKLEPAVAIPVHGIVQLVSNASRAYFLRSQIQWRAVWRFVWPLLPAGALGIWLLAYVPPSGSRIAIGAFVLASTWFKSFFSIGKGSGAERALPVGGALVGFFSTLVGATGPLLGPFILALELGAQPTIVDARRLPDLPTRQQGAVVRPARLRSARLLVTVPVALAVRGRRLRHRHALARPPAGQSVSPRGEAHAHGASPSSALARCGRRPRPLTPERRRPRALPAQRFRHVEAHAEPDKTDHHRTNSPPQRRRWQAQAGRRLGAPRDDHEKREEGRGEAKQEYTAVVLTPALDRPSVEAEQA